MGLGKWLKASLSGRRRANAAADARSEEESINTRDIVQEMFGRRRAPARADSTQPRETISSS